MGSVSPADLTAAIAELTTAAAAIPPYWTAAPEPPRPELHPDCTVREYSTDPAATGPMPNQFNLAFLPEDTWEQIFPDSTLDENRRIVSHKPPTVATYKQDLKTAIIKTKMLCWFNALHTGSSTDGSAEKALQVIEAANKQLQAAGLSSNMKDAKDFMTIYGSMLGATAAPPAIRTKMPTVVPTERVLLNRLMDPNRITASETAAAGTTDPNVGDINTRWKNPHRTMMFSLLTQIYMAHKMEVNNHNKWVEDEANLIKWHNTAVDTKSNESDRTITSVDIATLCRCKWPFCKWTICGKTVDFMEYPTTGNKDDLDKFKEHWKMPADMANRRPCETKDYRDDGRGDTARLERYQKAFKAHMDTAHALQAKNTIKEDPPEFKMRMSPEEFAEQKEQWRRYNQVHPPQTPEIHFDMLRRSMHVELYKVLKSDMDLLGNRIETRNGKNDVDRMMEVIELNAVTYTPNETYLRAFEAIKQEAGEKVDPYLSRLKTAAVKVNIKKRGTCSKNSCTEAAHPCTPAKQWYDFIATNAYDGALYICDSTKTEIPSLTVGLAPIKIICPPCCYEVEDEERRAWMIKKQFLTNMLSIRNKNQIYLRLQTTFSQQRVKGRFDALKFELPYIMNLARQIEEVFSRENENPERVQGGGGSQRDGKQKSQQAKPKRDQKDPKNRTQGGKQTNSKKMSGGILNGKTCSGCGGKPHGPTVEGKPTNNREARTSHCPAWGKNCSNCKKDNHLAKVCDGGKTRPIQGGAGNQNQPKKPPTEGEPPVEPPTPTTGGGGQASQLVKGLNGAWYQKGIRKTDDFRGDWDPAVGAGGGRLLEPTENLNWAEEKELESGNANRGEQL